MSPASTNPGRTNPSRTNPSRTDAGRSDPAESPLPLAGRGAVVTGGGRGIGAATARALAEAGASVVVSARSEDQIRAVAEELTEAGHTAHAVACDVTRPEQVESLRDRSAELLGQAPQILISNAGIATSNPLAKVSLEEWNRVFAVNVTGVFLCARAFVPAMVESGWGRVVHIASVAGKMGAPYITTYSASKHAVIGFTRSLAMELATRGVTVNAVCPGYVETEMTVESVTRMVEKTQLDPAGARAILERYSPQKRLFGADEVAFQALHLCHPSSSGITGQSIVLDGGGVQT